MKTPGYFFYAPQPTSSTAAITALRNWLIGAGNLTERELPSFLSAKRS